MIEGASRDHFPSGALNVGDFMGSQMQGVSTND